MLMDNNIDNLIINNLKSLSIDMINNAKSGHPGIALGATKIIYTLYKYHMNINYKDANLHFYIVCFIMLVFKN